MTRLTKLIDATQPLAKSTELRLRRFYKVLNPALPKNARVPQFVEALGKPDAQSAYAAIADLYNQSVRTQNEQLTQSRISTTEEARLTKNRKARERRAAKKRQS